MKMDENKKIFPIFLENKGEHKEILENKYLKKYMIKNNIFMSCIL